jgi:hypothetical protein
MIKATLELYALVFNKESYSYSILSEHSENLEPISSKINGKIEINNLLSLLFIKHTNVSSDFTTFICLDPYIKNSEELVIPYYCLILYNIQPQDCYLLPAKNYAYHISTLQKILNTI